MSLALAAALAIALVAFFMARSARKTKTSDPERDSTPAIEAWIVDTLEVELAECALGVKNATPEERKRVAQSLRGEPDPDVVSKVEDKVRDVELEYTRYVHESDAELLLRVHYEDGKATTASKRIAWNDVPASVRDDFESKKTSHVFRTWTLPWSRARAF
jgi:hypothetical protein